MSADKQQYDLVCSLGGNCAAAFQLQCRGKRLFSLPFDWCYVENERPLEYLPEGFADGFKNLALKENLKRVDGNKDHPVIYQDCYSGYFFPNHFKEDAEKEYDGFYKKLRRRTERLLDKIRNARRVLFIFSALIPFDVSRFERLSEKLSQLYPAVHFDFKLISFGCPAEEELTVGNITLSRCVRQQNFYDFYKTNYEWAFLDNVALPSKSHEQITLLSVRAFGKRFRLNFEIKRNDQD
ncbi:MAG: hypothetical protein J5787_03205 [Alphaproteobacteria bacterium]|nr:hypothetical protein [Alphaproteobacteria bacterium]